jgi:hypothetical protein
MVWLGPFLVSLAATHRSTTTTPTTTATASIQQANIEYDDILPNPHPDFTATDVVTVCMNTLIERRDGGGLEVCFNF